MSRLRTLSNAIKEIKAQDPDSAISPYWLRRAVKSGEIPSIVAGNRFLIDVDKLLNLEPVQIKPAGTSRGGLIRSIPER